MNDVISWGEKAQAMFGYAMAAHNAIWRSDEGYLRAGSMAGGAILLSFSVECALKALLEKEGKLITRSLWTHDLYKLFIGLETKTRTKASNVYEAFVESEGDVRVHKPPMDSLILCLKNHDDAFVNWRYNIGNAGEVLSRTHDVRSGRVADIRLPQEVVRSRLRNVVRNRSHWRQDQTG